MRVLKQLIEIIDIPGYGRQAAVKICEEYKIQSQNDLDRLAEAKGIVYKKGFYEGVMVIGEHAGMKVIDAKPLVRKVKLFRLKTKEMIDCGEALPYWEPEKKVESRSGDECIVAFVEQWYLDYGNDEWKNTIIDHISDASNFSTYNPSLLKHLLNSLEWLKSWACSRQFGLGTLVITNIFLASLG